MTSGLTKRFGKRLAVDGLDLRIPAGSITGFVGQNGAGKTTTIRMLLGLIRPTAGTGTVLGHPLGRTSAYLARVGALIEGPTFYPSLSGRENLMVLARLGGLEHARVDEVLVRVGLGPRRLDPFRTYSLGMRQRLGIAAALLPRPELLVLDEPTNGLDPHGIAEIRAMLRSFADEGMTVFVSSHLLAEIQQICEHLVVIEAGRLLFQGGVEELLAARAPELVVRTENPQTPDACCRSSSAPAGSRAIAAETARHDTRDLRRLQLGRRAQPARDGGRHHPRASDRAAFDPRGGLLRDHRNRCERGGFARIGEAPYRGEERRRTRPWS